MPFEDDAWFEAAMYIHVPMEVRFPSVVVHAASRPQGRPLNCSGQTLRRFGLNSQTKKLLVH